jgi:hypothetical protein
MQGILVRNSSLSMIYVKNINKKHFTRVRISMKITYQIRKEHPELLDGIDRLIAMKKGEEKRHQGLREMMINLDAHAKGEEQTIFPALLDLDKTKTIALRAWEEHRVLRIIMAEETVTGLNDDIWLPRLVVLRNFIKMHMQHEEDEVLNKADELLPESSLKELGKKFDFVKKTVKKTYITQIIA